ncbi:MAG: methyltransferase domain-containing protein [Proteobacteria bacterium]|nr:methyltransferase domain-containing protein [Pseudomonadota bacterium]NBP14476.1 methyltransferase domain-containing protein [bacterium]
MNTFNSCRCCGNSNLVQWLSLPQSPIANALYSEPNTNRYPLDINYCSSCGHMQLNSAPEPEGVFLDYRYKSGVSATFRKHFDEYSEYIHSTFFHSKTNISALEIGSNDGYLLNKFKEKGYGVLGIEPSKYLEQDHIDKGIPLIQDFFTTDLVTKHGLSNNFDVVFANNVLAHIPNIENVIEGISLALKSDGILVAECGDQQGILSGYYIDNVYHEHIDYYSPYSFSVLLEKYGLKTIAIHPISMHGQSFRIVASKKQSDSSIAVRTPVDFTSESDSVRIKINNRKLVIQALLKNRPFVAYGAAAKAVTSLYALELVDKGLISVVDDNPLKQNCYFPGTNILIQSPETIEKNALVLITAWNVVNDIKNNLSKLGHTGEVICVQ